VPTPRAIVARGGILMMGATSGFDLLLSAIRLRAFRVENRMEEFGSDSKWQNRADQRSSNPTLANSAREWGTHGSRMGYEENQKARGRATRPRLTLARKIAAICLSVRKKGERFDPKQLETQAA